MKLPPGKIFSHESTCKAKPKPKPLVAAGASVVSSKEKAAKDNKWRK